MKPIIRVQDLGKQYHIGKRQLVNSNLRETLMGVARDPFRHLRWNGDPPETFWALKDINLEVQQGDILGIIGRNGAGKSTLLKILSRITEPTTGRAEMHGRIGSLLEVGTGFHPELTGRENVFLNGAIIGMRREEINRKFDEIVDFSEIERFIDTPVKHYSSGMYTRLAFAVAAHLEPEILMIDEVLSVGDLAFQKKCIGKMSDVAGQGRTVLFVSHGIEAVRKICNRAVLLEHGELAYHGKTEDVIDRYLENGTNAKSAYTIPPPTPGENPPGFAYNLQIEDGDGKPSKSIPVGRPWQIRVGFEIVRPVEHFIIAIGLTTSLNAPLRTCWAEPRDIAPGKYEAVFREEIIVLGTGRYSVTVGLSSFERTFHYAPDAGVIQIEDFAEGIDLVRVSNVGYVLNPLQIDIQKIEQ